MELGISLGACCFLIMYRMYGYMTELNWSMTATNVYDYLSLFGTYHKIV